MDMTTTLARQLDELQLIRCSLIPKELMTFIHDEEIWCQLLENQESGVPSSLSTAHFDIKVETANIWFNVKMALSDPANPGHAPVISVKGKNVSRPEQERWQHIIQEKMAEIADTEYPIYQLISLHLLPLLHAEVLVSQPAVGSAMSEPTNVPRQFHALLTSHHLISPNKRRSLQQWSNSLSISGFAKVGYPGVIYAQGQQENIEEFVANIKAMQWLALKLRFLEPLAEVEIHAKLGKEWCEFQKVGEVVEEMRKIGREEYIVEMGIGSIGSK